MKNLVVVRTPIPYLAGAFLLASAAALGSAAQSSIYKHSTATFSCQGLSVTSLSADNGAASPKVEKSADKMGIVRRGQKLFVTVNGDIGKKLIGQADAFTDVYAITGETQEGIAAVQSDSRSPTVHTLVIDPAGKIALWTESTVWASASASRPFTETVFFSCTRK